MAEITGLSDSDENALLPPTTLDQDLTNILRIPRGQGSVLLDGKTSYSGVDIKVVIHIYDGGRAANERRNNLEQQIKDLETQIARSNTQRNQLQNSISGGSFTSQDVNLLDSLNRRILIMQNSIVAMNDESSRINKVNPEFSTKVLAEIQTLSVSSHREKFPVRALGGTYPKSFTRGPRTIAGSMIFTVFDRNVLEEFLEAHPSDFDAHNPTTTAIIDQIPPFDITVAFANELGQVSRMAIYGVELINEGQTMSIEDLLLENVVQFTARDYDPMRAVSRRKIDENNRLTNEIIPLKASSLLDEKDYQDFKDKLNPFDRYKRRANPFI